MKAFSGLAVAVSQAMIILIGPMPQYSMSLDPAVVPHNFEASNVNYVLFVHCKKIVTAISMDLCCQKQKKSRSLSYIQLILEPREMGQDIHGPNL
jgi:hypothetical protein